MKWVVRFPFIRLALLCPDMSTVNDPEAHAQSRLHNRVRPESISVDMYQVEVRDALASEEGRRLDPLVASAFCVALESLHVSLQRPSGTFYFYY